MRLHSVPVSLHVMKQAGLDLWSLLEVNGYQHLIACINYFTKWLETKPIRDKAPLTLATSLFELMCRHGWFEIQIND